MRGLTPAPLPYLAGVSAYGWAVYGASNSLVLENPTKYYSPKQSCDFHIH